MKGKIDIKAKTIKMDTGKGNTIKVTMSYGEQSTLEELLIAYLGQEIAGGSGLHDDSEGLCVMVVTGKNAENHILSKKVEKSGGQIFVRDVT